MDPTGDLRRQRKARAEDERKQEGERGSFSGLIPVATWHPVSSLWV